MIVIYLCSLWLKTWPLFLDHTFTIMELSRKPHELKRGGEGGRGGGGKGEGGRGEGGKGEGGGGRGDFYSYLVPLDHSIFLATLYHVNNICLQKSVELVRLKLFGRPSFLVPFNP